MTPLPCRFPFLRRLPLVRSLLRDFLAFRPRLGKADRDRLLAACDFLAGATALQRPGLALFHRALDIGGCLFRILPCHDSSPRCGKIIVADGDGSRQDESTDMNGCWSTSCKIEG